MTEKSVIWKCHPDLEKEWNLFTEDCQNTSKENDDLNSELWMDFWRCKVPSSAVHTNILKNRVINEVGSIEKHEDTDHVMKKDHEASDSSTALKDSPPPIEDHTVPLTSSQQQQSDTIAVELLDILDMASDSIPDDLKDDISSLPPHVLSSLLKELQMQLSEQGIYNFCNMLCEDSDHWVNIKLVFEVLFLPKLLQDAQKSLGEEVKAGLKRLTECFPAECVSNLLQPLLANDVAASLQLDLLSDLVPLLPEKDFIFLLRYFVLQCSVPIEEWKILVLNCLLMGASSDVLKDKAESPLTDLMPILSSSARGLSSNESFARLLLNVIPALKGNTSVRVHNELMAIVQQNNSFNKQALLNAMKN